METSINIQKSIDKRKLIYENRSIIADNIITYIGGFFFITLAVILLVTKISVMPFWMLVIVVCFIIWMVANMVLFNTLIKVNGLSINSNRKVIITVLNEFFHLNIEDRNQVIIKDVKSSGFIRWGRVVTVLLEKDSVYINIQTLGRADAFSFFHGLSNYLKCKRIANRFSQSLLKETQR